MRGKADGRRKMVGLIGFSGVGKTCTAQQYAHHNSQAYPGGIYYIHAKTTNN
jgi:ABC-type dipeptide/oligopeptide/nickel transport system ATPase component